MEPKQGDLELPFPELGGDQPPIPVRTLNEHPYCPRLAYLEWVQGEWADSADTVEGRHKHQRMDKPSGDLPDAETAEEEHAEIHARSITRRDPQRRAAASLKSIEAQHVGGDAPSLTATYFTAKSLLATWLPFNEISTL